MKDDKAELLSCRSPELERLGIHIVDIQIDAHPDVSAEFLKAFAEMARLDLVVVGMTLKIHPAMNKTLAAGMRKGIREVLHISENLEDKASLAAEWASITEHCDALTPEEKEELQRR